MNPETYNRCVAYGEFWGPQAVLLARLEARDQMENVLEHLSDEMHKSLQVRLKVGYSFLAFS